MTKTVMPIDKIDQEELKLLLGKSRATIFNMRHRDPTFPRPIDLKPLRWVRAHVMSWVDSMAKV